MNDLLLVLIGMATIINCLASVYINAAEKVSIDKTTKLVIICGGYSIFAIIVTLFFWEG